MIRVKEHNIVFVARHLSSRDWGIQSRIPHWQQQQHVHEAFCDIQYPLFPSYLSEGKSRSSEPLIALLL